MAAYLRVVTIVRRLLVVAVVLGGAASVAPGDELSHALRSDAANWRPVTEYTLASHRAALRQSLANLDGIWQSSGPEGAAWREYLLWTEAQQLGQGTFVSAARVQLLERRFENARVWWEDAELVAAAEAVRDLAAGLRAIMVPAAGQSLQLAQLADAWDRAGGAPSLADRQAMVGLLDQLDKSGGLTPSARALEQRVLQANGVIRFDANWLGRRGDRQVNEAEGIDDCKKRTQICGTAVTTGRSNAKSLADECRADSALMHTEFVGTNVANTTAYAGRVTVDATVVSQLQGVKQVRLLPGGAVPLCANANSCSSMCIDNVCVCGGNLMAKFAASMAERQRPQAEADAAQQTSDRLAEKMDEEGSKAVGKFNDRYREQIGTMLLDRDDQSTRIAWQSSDSLYWNSWQRALGERVVVNAPPPAPLADVLANLHQTHLEFVSTAKYAGRRVGADEFADGFGGLIADGKAEEVDEDWSIVFAATSPIKLEIDNDIVKARLDIAEFESEGAVYQPMIVEVEYKMSVVDTALHLTRTKPLSALPPGFVSGKDKLTGRQQALRQLMQRKLGQSFREELVCAKLKAKGDGENDLEFVFAAAAGKAGWLQWSLLDAEYVAKKP